MKTDVQTARRNLNSPNIKTRKRALKLSNNIKSKVILSYFYIYIYKRDDTFI